LTKKIKSFLNKKKKILIDTKMAGIHIKTMSKHLMRCGAPVDDNTRFWELFSRREQRKWRVRERECDERRRYLNIFFSATLTWGIIFAEME
jgi:hypothetical protein